MTETPLSIIVPVLNEAAGIQAFLHSLQPLREKGHEVILVDGGSCDDTLVLSGNLVDLQLRTRPGRAVQMNAGAASASHGVLLFLHADTFLPEQAVKEINSALASHMWGRFDIRLQGSHPMLRVIAWSMNMRSRLTGVATGDQAIFVRRPVFESLGGFPAIPLMEDVALSKKLRRVGRPACLRLKVSSSGRRWQKQGVWHTIWLMWRLRLAWSLGSSPGTLVARYSPDYSPVISFIHNSVVVQLFARAPVPGRVKTRLASTIGDDAACRVHTSLLFRQLGWLQATTLCQAELWIDGRPDAQPFLASGLPVHRQSEGDLGERMGQAIRDGLQRYSRVILVGSDCPTIDSTLAEQAVAALHQHDVVLAPASDGGYVLVGMKRYVPELFADMPWSTPAVLAETCSRLEAVGCSYALLPLQQDVDDEISLGAVRSAGFYISGPG